MNARRLFFSFLITVASASASAAQINCIGTVTKMYVSKSDNGVYVLGSYSPTWAKVCALTTTWKGVAPETCRTWFSIAQAAYHAETEVNVSYDSGDITSCGAIPTYSNAPSPNYLMHF